MVHLAHDGQLPDQGRFIDAHVLELVLIEGLDRVLTTRVFVGGAVHLHVSGIQKKYLCKVTLTDQLVDRVGVLERSLDA